jgi:hypothetical protein
MADETVEIDVNVNTNTEQAEGNFTRLQTQIRETTRLLQAAEAAGDQVAFRNYKKQLDDLEDKLEVTTLKQKQFDDTLAAAPGPLGKAGQAVKAFDGVLKFLAANPVVAILAGLAAVLTTVIAAMQKTQAGTAALTAVTDAFSNILQPVIEFISKAAVPVFKAFADIINFFGTSLGLVDEKVVKAKENFRLLEGQIKQNNATLESEIALMEAQGKGIDKTAKKKKEQIDGEIQLLKEKKIAFGEITADEEAKIIELENKKKIIDAEVEAYNKKKADEAKKKRSEKFKEELKELADLQKTRLEVIDQYTASEKYRLDKEKAEGKITEAQYQKEIFETQQIANNDKLVEQDRFFARRNEKLKEGLAAGLITEEEYGQLSTENLRETSTAKDEIIKTGYDQEISYIDSAAKKLLELQKINTDVNNEIAKSWVELGSTIGGTFATLGGLFEEGSDMAKAFGVISVLINGAAAVGKIILDSQEAISSARKTISIGTDAIAQGVALSPLNPVIGGALIAAGTVATTKGAASIAKTKLSAGLQIAAVAATSAAQVAAILSAGKNKSTGGTANAGSAGGDSGGGTPAFSTPTIGAPQIGVSQNQQGQLAGIVAGALDRNNSQGQPIRAYVIGNEITSEQQLQRRIRTAARLGG